MKYKFCSIHINVTKFYITFATRVGEGEEVSNPNPHDYVTGTECI